MLNFLFNNATAGFLQQIAILFEMGGLSLVIVDIFLPKKSEVIERKIDTVLQKFYDEDIIGVPKRIINSIFSAQASPYTVMHTLVVFIFGSLSVLLSFYMYSYVENVIQIKWLIWLFSLMSASCLVVISGQLVYFGFISIVILFGFALSALDEIANGKALAGFGLILASAGTACELYQVITLCLDQGCYGLIEGRE